MSSHVRERERQTQRQTQRQRQTQTQTGRHTGSRERMQHKWEVKEELKSSGMSVGRYTLCFSVLCVYPCQPLPPPIACCRKSSFPVLVVAPTCTGDSSGKSQRNPANSRPGAQNIGPNGLDCCATATRSCLRAARRPPARWLPLVRRRVRSERVVLQPNMCSRHPPIGDSCLSCEAPVAGAHTRRSAWQRCIDRGRSDLCSVRQHGRCGRFSCVQGAQLAQRPPASPSSAGGAPSAVPTVPWIPCHEYDISCVRPAGLNLCRRLQAIGSSRRRLVLCRSLPMQGFGFNARRRRRLFRFWGMLFRGRPEGPPSEAGRGGAWWCRDRRAGAEASILER